MAVVSEEQTDLLVNIRETSSVEDGLQSVPVPNSFNNHKARLSLPSGKFKSYFRPIVQPVSDSSGCWFQRLPSSHRCLFHVAALSHIFLGLALLVTIPVYTKVVQEIGSDAYSGTYLVVFLSTTVLVLLVALRKFWDPKFSICHQLPISTLLCRDALLFSLGLLGCSYARSSPDNVPCHLQDGLLFLFIPFSIIFMMFKRSKARVNKNVKLISILTSFLALLFISVVPQLAYKSGCRGAVLDVDEENVKEPMDTAALWTCAYVICIGFISCSITNFLSSVQDHEESNRSFEWSMWFHFFVLCVLSLLFWTDLFPSLGGTDGTESFWSKFSSIWIHHFTINGESNESTSRLGLVLPVFWLLFVYVSNLLVYRFQSNPVHVVCNAGLSLVFLPIFYCIFHVGSGQMFVVRVAFTIGGFFSLVLFPVAYLLLGCYHNASVVLNLLDGFDIF